MTGLTPFNINEQYMVFVRLEREKGRADYWATVRIVTCDNYRDAIRMACEQTPELFDYVNEGKNTFVAIPINHLPMTDANVFRKEEIVI